jgi:hypothetical protein
MRLVEIISYKGLKLFAVSDSRNCGENCIRSTNINSIADFRKVMKYRSSRGPARPQAPKPRVSGRFSQGNTTTREVNALWESWHRIL